MAARMQKRRTISKRSSAAALLIGVVTTLVVFGLVALSVTPVKYDITVDAVAPATITASKDITDTVTTQELMDEAQAQVAPVYSIDGGITQAVKEEVSGFFADVVKAAGYVKQEYIDSEIRDSIYTVSRETLEEQYDPAEVDWQFYLSDAQLQQLRAMTGGIEDELIYAVAALSEAQIENLGTEVETVVNESLGNGIRDEHLETEKQALAIRISALVDDQNTARLLVYPVDKYIETNMIYDEAATQQAILNARQSVVPVTYKQSQTVVVEGEVVTEAQMKVLSDLGVIGGEGTDYKLYIGVLLFILLLFGAYAVYMYQFESETLADTRKLLILATITVLVTAMAVALARVDSRILPVFFGTMLASVLVSRKSALALGVLLAFVAGAACSWNSGLISAVMLRTVMMGVVGGAVSVFMLYKPGHRTALILSGLAAGAANLVIAVVINLMGSVEFIWNEFWQDGAYALGSALLAGVLVIGTLPIWEAVFRVSTPTKLLELSNPNHPLLKRLTIEAPGTYHHSILTANLAEAGAEAIGANSLLCRVGAYFHDVGKLDNPMYFKENQKDKNPHDDLPPERSARIITGHLTSGLEYAQRFKLPRDVQKIISQHHGDTHVEYFLYKAKQNGGEVDEAKFKYSGSKPVTKESAVVMLADNVEAAVRSMDDPDKEQVKEMINGLIKKRYNEGQLDECPLNRRDLNIIAKAFYNTYEGVLHERVKYPGQEK